MPAFSPQRLVPALKVFPDARRCWVAYSGGMDSAVLLHALAMVRPQLPFDLRAIHVDHGLHADSPSWAEHCRASCEALGVPLTRCRLTLTRVPGESLEALAREARYAAMRRVLGAGDLLLTAQHLDDQAETLLLALMRGSGVKGLASMPPVAPFGEAWLLRPLLEYGRADLLDYASAQGLAWVEDPSNADVSQDRNFLRAEVLPLLRKRWPSSSASLARTAGHCAEAQGLIDGLARRELTRVRGSRPSTLAVSALLEREPALVRATLRRWIHDLGLPVPDSRHLSRIEREGLRAGSERSPLISWKGCQIRRYRDELFAMSPLPALPTTRVLVWDRGALELPLPPGLGRLTLYDGAGGTLDPCAASPGPLEVRFGCPGCRCRPGGGARRRPLKKLFQEAGVPPWLRVYVPYLFAAGQLVAVGDLWRCECFGSGLRVRWVGGIREHPGFGGAGRRDD